MRTQNAYRATAEAVQRKQTGGLAQTVGLMH